MSTTSSSVEFPAPNVWQMYQEAKKQRDDDRRRKREAAERRRQAELVVLDELAALVMESLADSPYQIERATQHCVHVKGIYKSSTTPLEIWLSARNRSGQIEPMIRWSDNWVFPNQFAEAFVKYLLTR